MKLYKITLILLFLSTTLFSEDKANLEKEIHQIDSELYKLKIKLEKTQSALKQIDFILQNQENLKKRYDKQYKQLQDAYNQKTNLFSKISENLQPYYFKLSSKKEIRVRLSFGQPYAIIKSDKKAKVFIDGKFSGELDNGSYLFITKDENILKITSDYINANGGKVIQIHSSTYSEILNWDRYPAWDIQRRDEFNDNKFESILEFRVLNGNLIAINELDIEKYMRGIAEESEDTEVEKLKTMAVLTRSYAMHYMQSKYKKYPSFPYDASDSPKEFQKYRGYGSSLRAKNWKKAIDATKGEVLIYKDEVLKAAYFSCTDGKTKSVDEVGFSQKYFQLTKDVYKSVNDPYGKNMDKYKRGLCGHGLGLSGQGASALAKRGYDYKEIINYYYNDIEIKYINN